MARQTGRVIAATPAGYLERPPDLGVADETPILIVGMPRSGTTLVEQILSSHPDVATGGELGFWIDRNRDGVGVFDAAARPEAAPRLAQDYLAALRAVSPAAARVTDKMPFNFGLLGLICRVFPHATIVHCRRHPVDTCLSIFCTARASAGLRRSASEFFTGPRATLRNILCAGVRVASNSAARLARPGTIVRHLAASRPQRGREAAGGCECCHKILQLAKGRRGQVPISY